MNILRLGIDLVDEAAAVMRASYDAALPTLAGRHSPEEDRRFFRQVVFPQCAVWGVLGVGRLRGVMAIRPGWIDQLYVAPDWQRGGIGTALLQAAFATEPTLDLWTLQRNTAARRFYERHGFRAVALTDGSRNEEREPDVRYRWERVRVVGGDGFEPPALSV